MAKGIARAILDTQEAVYHTAQRIDDYGIPAEVAEMIQVLVRQSYKLGKMVAKVERQFDIQLFEGKDDDE